MADLTGQTIEIPMASVAKGMEVNVQLTGYRRWHLRLRVGIALMRFAVWVSGMGFKVEEPPDTPPGPVIVNNYHCSMGVSPDVSDDESFGGDAHLTERGKATIGTLRQMRANGDPRVRCYSVRKHAFVSCSHIHCRGRRSQQCPPP